MILSGCTFSHQIYVQTCQMMCSVTANTTTTTAAAATTATVGWPCASTITMVYNGSHLCGPNNIGSTWCDTATTADPKRHNEWFCRPHHYAAARTTSVQDAFSGRHMPTVPQVLCRLVFSFRLEPPNNSYVTCWCLSWCLLPAFRFQCGCHFHQ